MSAGRGRPRTKPLVGMQQVPVRIHAEEYKLVKRLLLRDELSFQTLVKTWIDGYMKGDPRVSDMLKGAVVRKTLADAGPGFTLPQAERQELIRQIEAEISAQAIPDDQLKPPSPPGEEA